MESSREALTLGLRPPQTVWIAPIQISPVGKSPVSHISELCWWTPRAACFHSHSHCHLSGQKLSLRSEAWMCAVQLPRDLSVPPTNICHLPRFNSSVSSRPARRINTATRVYSRGICWYCSKNEAVTQMKQKCFHTCRHLRFEEQESQVYSYSADPYE